MLSDDKAIAQARLLKGYQDAERRQLDVIRRYWKGRQKLPAVIPTSSPAVVKTMARIARVNFTPIIVDSLSQSLFVDGFRGKSNDAENADVWRIWQANKLDARQTGIHRAALAYGTAYAVVTPGEPVAVIRGVSPRHMTAMYGEDPDWPIFALERFGKGTWRLYDETAVYFLASGKNDDGKFEFIEAREHGAIAGGVPVTPVVRYIDEDDLDDGDEASAEMGDRSWDPMPTRGQIAPMTSLQDQVDLTTFGLLVAQHYSAFRQRYVIGWVPEDEAQRMKASASQLWTFEDAADGSAAAAAGEGIKVGEFGQTDLGGYIESREASLRHAATLSQTPVHELLGELVNLSAEALAAAENGHERKVDERKTLFGESHEQTLRLAGELSSISVPDDAQVVWRDTSARTFAATVDALGKLVTMLGVPPQELWQKIPGVTQQDVERWRAEAQSGDAFAQLQALLEKQAAPPVAGG
jgi:hypothetical protein